MKVVLGFLFVLLASAANASCPVPLKDAQPGWFVESYDKSVPFDDKAGLISPPPINAMSMTLPASFAQLGRGGDFPNFAFLARVQICETGSYEFYVFVERVRPFGPPPTCRITMRVNGSRIADTNAAIRNELHTVSGRLSLEPGWAETRLSLSCSGNTFMQAYASYLGNIYLAAKVRGPNDNLQRDFAPGEIVNLGRATLSPQDNSQAANAGERQAPSPPVTPAAIPEQLPQRSHQNLKIN